MSVSGLSQKKPAVHGVSVTDAVDHSQESGGNPESSAENGVSKRPRELGGPAGLEPTRYGDWERKGRCIDF